MKKTIYLDYNATTPVDKSVLEAMLPYFSENFGNASSRTHTYGWLANDAVKNGREQVAELINCTPQEIAFTSGSTEAINLAIKGVWDIYKKKGQHIITVKTEHKAVLDTCKALEAQGAEITYLDVDHNGLIDLKQLEESLKTETILVAVMYANNETGVVQPISKIAEFVHSNKSIFLCDATQAIGKVPIDVQTEGIDLMCISAHKMYGPKGVGALYVRRRGPRVNLLPQITGGGHERGLRSGTLNVAGIVALGKACEIAQHDMAKDEQRINTLRELLEFELLKLDDIVINSKNAKRLFNTTSITFKGLRSEKIIAKLIGIAVAMGSACTAATDEPSHVLKAMNIPEADISSTLRFSLGKLTTEEEIRTTVETLKKALNSLKKDI